MSCPLTKAALTAIKFALHAQIVVSRITQSPNYDSTATHAQKITMLLQCYLPVFGKKKKRKEC
jgi:hypothetical protein